MNMEYRQATQIALVACAWKDCCTTSTYIAIIIIRPSRNVSNRSLSTFAEVAPEDTEIPDIDDTVAVDIG